MAYQAQNKDMSWDKLRFYSSVNNIKEADEFAAKKNYPFLATNRLKIDQEFNQVFSSLQANDKDRESFWLYCYYCCVMLQAYYEAYGDPTKKNSYLKLSERIKKRIEQGKFSDETPENETFIRSLKKKIAADLRDLVDAPRHTTKIRDWVGLSNVYRIHVVFSRLAIKQTLLLAQELKWLDKLDKLFGIHVNADKMVANINSITPAMNVLSVGFFVTRFIINAGLLLKHTFFPTEAEKELRMLDRFRAELYKRYCTMLNDIVWATVNTLCNFSAFFHIAAPVANWLTAVFLLFDVSLLIHRRYMAEREYLAKKEQYLYEKRNYQALMDGANLKLEDMKKYKRHCDMLDEQLTQLEISWKVTSATYQFNIAAAAFLMSGFSASLLLTAIPVAIPICYLVCAIGVAMYLTADMYGKYKEKTLILQQQKLEGLNTAVALLDAQTARNDFILAMVKNTVMPMLIVMTFAASWPAALILAAAYIGYECGKGYFADKPVAPKKPVFLPPPKAEKEAERREEPLMQGVCAA